MEIISHSYKHKPIPRNQCVDRENKKKEEEKGQRRGKRDTKRGQRKAGKGTYQKF